MHRSGLTLTVFVISVFTSAFLLFAIQPMFTRMVLPQLGGSPSVWSVAMVFFQTLLLAGYAYAHLLTRIQRPAVPVAIHLVLLLTAALTLPLAIRQGWGDPPARWAEFWLLGLFTVSIGLPFFALAANNPLLQAWFVRSGHVEGHDPYFLYAASNVGSFLALVSYPALFEPTLALRHQNLAWSAGFAALFVMIAACGYLMLSSPARVDVVGETRQTPAPGWLSIGRWVFLAAVPSGLLVAVTAHISTDVAAAPLLWVMPLSLYLLTWVLVFQRKPPIPHRWVLALQPIAVAGLILLIKFGTENQLVLNLSGHLAVFFVMAMTCHGELARSRPPAEHLTTFYVSLSAGGMVGGLFAGLAAPYLFSWIAEYPILVALAVLCRPWRTAQARGLTAWLRQPAVNRVLWAVILAMAAAVLLPRLAFRWAPGADGAWLISAALVATAALAVLLIYDPRKSATVVATAFGILYLYPSDQARFETVRSFFGVHKIFDTADGRFRVLMHGSTIHGAQALRDESGREIVGRPRPIAYYSAFGSIAQGIAAIRARKGTPMRVAAIGLGSGTLACHIAPGETWRFFEIDPSVIAIARDPRRFSFVSSCAPEVPVILGDARLTLAHEPDGAYDLVIVDAYSSDAIPVHLATQEAMAIYKSKLAPGGAVMMHISNRHLELASVAVGIAAANGLSTWVYTNDDDEGDDDNYIFPSEVAISAARPQDIGALAASKTWIKRDSNAAIRTWTDDYSNVLGAILRKWKE